MAHSRDGSITQVINNAGSQEITPTELFSNVAHNQKQVNSMVDGGSVFFQAKKGKKKGQIDLRSVSPAQP